jgi:ribosomal protein S18 acetylase RimI-like enzyme
MPTDVTLRCLGPGDAALLEGADVFDGPVVPRWLAGFLADPAHLIVVAQMGNRVVGFASGAVLHHPDKPPALFIMELGVNDDARRQGIATALVAALRDEGRARGADTAWVLTEACNTPARALYRHLGAKETPDVVMFDWDAPAAPFSSNA